MRIAELLVIRLHFAVRLRMGGFRRLVRLALGSLSRGGRPAVTHRASPAWTRHLNFHTTCGYVNAARIRDGWVREFASSSNDDDTHPTTSQSTPPPTVHGWGSSGEDFTDPDGSKRRQIEVAIDRTGLFRQIDEAHGMGNENKKNLKGLEKHLASIINFRGGPITVAEYMQEVLTHPEWGYYMHRDVFGEKGDFITSPEVSQVFGELMGAWAVWQWEQMGKPREVRLVEGQPKHNQVSIEAV